MDRDDFLVKVGYSISEYVRDILHGKEVGMGMYIRDCIVLYQVVTEIASITRLSIDHHH